MVRKLLRRNGPVTGAIAIVMAAALSACGGEKIDFGDDTSAWANDGECDDPRFEGPGTAATLRGEDLGRDASDCRRLYEEGRIRLREGAR